MTTNSPIRENLSNVQLRLLQMVFDRFQSLGEWPTMRELHVDFLPHGDVWEEAERIGFPLIKERGDKSMHIARMKLSIEAIWLCDGSANLLRTFVEVLKLCAQTYLANPSDPKLSCRQLQEDLRLSDHEFVLLDKLILVADRIWEKCPTGNDPQLDTFTLLPDVASYRNIERIEQYIGYLQEARLKSSPVPSARSTERLERRISPSDLGTLHPAIQAKCAELYLDEHYAEAATKGFKVVKDRLRELTNFERASDAFGKGGLSISSRTEEHVQGDFGQGVKFLAMAVDYFRNAGSHTSEDHIKNPIVAYEFLRLSSLVMHILDNAVRPDSV